MTTALWIIAICEIIRTLQNAYQLLMFKHDTKGRDNAYAEFVKSLKSTDKEFVKRLLEEIDKPDEGKTETWNGYHGRVTAPKGTFKKIYEDREDDNNADV